MKTTIEYASGEIETYPDVAPLIYDHYVLFGDTYNDLPTEYDDIPLDLVKRVVFENDEAEPLLTEEETELVIGSIPLNALPRRETKR